MQNELGSSYLYSQEHASLNHNAFSFCSPPLRQFGALLPPHCLLVRFSDFLRTLSHLGDALGSSSQPAFHTTAVSWEWFYFTFV